jgi:putative protease
MHTHPLPELLAPAGSFDAALAAFAYGADAIYLGLSRFSARADAANFDDEAFKRIVAYAHGLERPRKVYVTLNTLLETRERADLLPSLELLREVGVDAVIVQDLGLAAIIHQHFPEIQLHASTQLACTSTAGARALVELGFTRIVTARELTLEEAATIGQRQTLRLKSSFTVRCAIASAACASFLRSPRAEAAIEVAAPIVAVRPFVMAMGRAVTPSRCAISP